MNPKRGRSWKRRIRPRERTQVQSQSERTTGEQDFHREVEPEGHEEKYRDVIEGATP